MRIALFALLLFTVTSFAQFHYEKGYFIDNNGKRTECYIHNTNWNFTPTDIHYKLQENGERSTKTIFEIREFGLNDIVTCKRYIVKIDLNTNEIRKMAQSSAPTLTEKPIFLKLIVSGMANLYSYTDITMSRYFYETATIPL